MYYDLCMCLSCTDPQIPGDLICWSGLDGRGANEDRMKSDHEVGKIKKRKERRRGGEDIRVRDDEE